MFTPKLPASVDEVRIDTLEFWTASAEEREGAFALLRRERPISFHEEFVPPPEVPLPRGPGYWAVTRHADVVDREPPQRPVLLGQGREHPGHARRAERVLRLDDRDGRPAPRAPAQHRLARLHAEGARAPAGRRRAARQRADRRDHREGRVRLRARPRGAASARDHLRHDGDPREPDQFVFEQTNIILGLTDPEYVAPGTNPFIAALTSGKALAELMNELAAERRRKPKDDLTSQLLNAEIDGETLTDQELASFFVLLVVAGNETTRNAISHGMKALCDHPDERRKWAADFEGVAAAAVEEIVRWASPVIHFRRTSTQDTELGGQKLRAGEKIVLWYNSANRDEAVFAEPYRFDVTREPNEHVGFGGPGAHHCLGANLARREITVVFRELFRRLPGPRDHRRARDAALELHPRHQAHAVRVHAGRSLIPVAASANGTASASSAADTSIGAPAHRASTLTPSANAPLKIAGVKT